MSTTFAVRTPNGELKEVARRLAGPDGASLYWIDAMAELLPALTEVEATDNTPQGIFTIGDIKYFMDKQNKASDEVKDESWIKDHSKIEVRKRNSAFVPLDDAWHKEHDFVEVTEWSNGEGWDIAVSDEKHISLHHTEFAVIKELIALLEKD